MFANKKCSNNISKILNFHGKTMNVILSFSSKNLLFILNQRLIINQKDASGIKETDRNVFSQVAMPLLLMLVTIFVSISSAQISSNSEPPRVFTLSDYGKRDDLRVLYSAAGGAEANKVAQIYEQLISSSASFSQV
jgi:hypothetical protein